MVTTVFGLDRYINCLILRDNLQTLSYMNNTPTDDLFRGHLTELLRGGFAPVVILLREFHFDKAGIVLGCHDHLPSQRLYHRTGQGGRAAIRRVVSHAETTQ